MKSETITLVEWAQRHGITPSLAQYYAHRGRIAGIRKSGKVYLVPSDSPMPDRLQPGPKPKAVRK